MFIIPFLRKLFIGPNIQALGFQFHFIAQLRNVKSVFYALKLQNYFLHSKSCLHTNINMYGSNLDMKMYKKNQKHEDAYIYKICTCYKKYP
jgi:hypothetical protein